MDFHSHFGISLMVADDAEFMVETKTAAYRTRAALVKPDVYHRVYSEGRIVVILIELTPEETGILGLLADKDDVSNLSFPFPREISKQFQGLFPGEKNCAPVRQFCESVTRPLMATQLRKRSCDGRIARIIDRLCSDEAVKINAAELARNVDLSPDRLIRLFKKETGITLRRYLIWRKILKVVRQYAQYNNLTDAALTSGFYDSSHLSNIFRRSFGFKPSFFFGPNRKTNVVFCGNWGL